MTQKWNLQDIRPTSPKPKRATPGPTTVIRRDDAEAEHIPVRSLNKPTATDIRTPEGAITRGASTPISFTERLEQNKSDYSQIPYRGRNQNTEEESGFFDEDSDPIPVIDGKKTSRRHLTIAVIIFVVIATSGLFISHLTGGATVTIQPKVRELNVNAEFTAYKEQKPGELAYTILTLEAESERQVEASGQEEVKIQATGEIEITKSTPGAERLIKNTRFMTEGGIIFRIEESVVVPGAVTVDGKSTAGSIRAKVFADEAGTKHNLKAGTKLSIPGFKENDLLDLYDAMSATVVSDITNGFAGPKFIINEESLATARQSLQAELRDNLLARIDQEKPANFTTFKGSVAITYVELPTVEYGDKLVTIKEQAILQMPLFNADDFAEFIAKETIVGYEDEGVRIGNTNNLNFAYTSATTSSSNIANEPSLTFKITGMPQIIWTYDAGKLKFDLLSKEKTAIPQILASYTGIEKSEVKIRPIWKRTMPKEHSDIEIIEQLPEEK